MEKKTITLNLSILKPLILAYLLAIITIFIIEHFGEFNYYYTQKLIKKTEWSESISYNEYEPVKGTDLVSSFSFESPFGNVINYDGGKWRIFDMMRSNRDFYNYSNTVQYYLKSTFHNYTYILILGLIYFTIYLFLKKIRIKLQ